MNTLLNEAATAEELGVKPATLRKWRCYGGGPRFVRVGVLIRYRRDELDAYIESRTYRNTTQADHAAAA